MTKPNNPYDRPIDATKEGAMRQIDYDGAQSSDKVLSQAAGKRAVEPAGRWSSAPYEPPKQPKVESHSVRNENAPVTAEDLFG